MDQNRNENKVYFYEQDSSDECTIVFMHNVDPVNYVSRRHYHRAIEIGFMVNGSAGYIVNEHSETINTGDIAYIDSWDIHYFDIRKNNETYTLVIGTEYLRSFYKLYGDSENIPFFDQALRNHDVNARVLNILRQWEGEYDANNKLLNIGFINLIFAELAKGYPVRLRKQNRKEVVALNGILEYISKNYKSNISLEIVAKALGYNPNHCSKVFHDYINQDFRNYVNGVRIEAARRMMLEEPDKRVTDIALDCGFTSLNAFYRAYKRIFKKTPRQ